MKIRNGFVSNSSSSSFMIGIARVIDENKLNTYIKENNISNIKIEKIADIKNHWEFSVRDNKIILESFISDVRTSFDSENDKIIYIDYCGGDDSDFWTGDEYDYDVDLSDFDNDMIQSYELFNKENIGITDASYSYGAGRNG